MHDLRTAGATPPFPAAPPPPTAGDPAPDFELVANGTATRLSSLRGSPVVLVLHNPEWDPARREQIDAFNRLLASLPAAAEQRLITVGAAHPWLELEFDTSRVALPVIRDDDGSIAQAYGVHDTPAVFVIDERGIVRWTHMGRTPPREGDIIAALTSFAARDEPRSSSWNRREFIATVLGVAASLTISPRLAVAERIAAASTAPGAARAVTLNVNGRQLRLTLEPRVSLLDALREYAGLTGTKKGCDHGQCGACTVHVDGRRTLSCLTFAMMHEGQQITTIEGLAASAGTSGNTLHPMQQAFIKHDGFQCGYCTPGQIMSASAMIHEPWGAADSDVREAMSGNICRCGAYPGIVAAIQEVRANAADGEHGQ